MRPDAFVDVNGSALAAGTECRRPAASAVPLTVQKPAAIAVPLSIAFLILMACCAIGQSPAITGLAFAPGGDEVVSVSQLGLSVYTWPDLKLARTVPLRSPHPVCLAFSPTGTRLAAGGGMPSEEGMVETFQWPNLNQIDVITEHFDTVHGIDWLDESAIVSASLDRTAVQSSLLAAGLTKRFEGHSRGVLSTRVLADERLLITAAIDTSVRVWDLDTGSLQRSLNQHTGPVHSIAVQPNSNALPVIATAAEDRTIRFWQPMIGRMMRYVRLDSVPQAIGWTHDATRVFAACRDGRVRIIDPVNVLVTQTLPGIDGWAYCIAQHPTDGSLVVAGEGGQISRVTLGPNGMSRD